MSKRVDRTAGFTLLEVLIAFAIAGIALVAFFRSAGVGLGAVGTAGSTLEATALAQDRLVLASREPLAAGESSGVAGGYTWQTVVTLAAPGQSGDKPDLYRIGVTVMPASGGQRRVTLTGYAIAQGPAK